MSSSCNCAFGEFKQGIANVEGTLAGFRSPAYAQGIGVAGFTCTFYGRISTLEDTHSTIGFASVKRRFAQCMLMSSS